MPHSENRHMSREKIKKPISEDLDAVRNLESQRYSSRNFQGAIESGPSVAYEWFEDNVIQKKASVEFKKDGAGRDSATIRMKNLDTNKEEMVYYTTDETEVARLKAISEGRPILVEVPEEDSDTEPKTY